MTKIADEVATLESKIGRAQAFIEGLEVAEMGIQFALEFRDIYPDEVIGHMLAVGPMQAFIGLAIKNGHLALPSPYR